MILTTTPSVEGKHIGEYLGIVCAQSNKMIRSTLSEQGISGALSEVENKAIELGADAVVGVQFVGPPEQSYGTIHVFGTAVKFK